MQIIPALTIREIYQECGLWNWLWDLKLRPGVCSIYGLMFSHTDS